MSWVWTTLNRKNSKIYLVQNRLKFNLALDNLASKLVSALVENQIKLDQGQFHSCFTQNQNSSQSLITSQNKRNKGILKSQNKQNYSPFPLGKFHFRWLKIYGIFYTII